MPCSQVTNEKRTNCSIFLPNFSFDFFHLIFIRLFWFRIRRESKCHRHFIAFRRTKEQQHFFNCPYQLSKVPTQEDLPELASKGMHRLVRWDVYWEAFWIWIWDINLLRALSSLHFKFTSNDNFYISRLLSQLLWLRTSFLPDSSVTFILLYPTLYIRTHFMSLTLTLSNPLQSSKHIEFSCRMWYTWNGRFVWYEGPRRRSRYSRNWRYFLYHHHHRSATKITFNRIIEIIQFFLTIFVRALNRLFYLFLGLLYVIAPTVFLDRSLR